MDRRKLVAIMYADMVGYSRLIGLDDQGTLNRLRVLRRNLIDPTIEKHGGRVVQTGGDSLLVVFDSIDGAVRCAVKVQQELPNLDDGQPADRTIRFRVGINLGDAIADGTDLHGDAVNVAARLQAECPPGGICVSRSVRDHVHGRVGLEFKELGALNLKNIARPIEAFVIQPAGTGGAVTDFPNRVPLASKPSIAVLPFANMSGEADQQYFSEGIADDIITELSHVRSLLVVARNSSFTYRGRTIDVRTIGRELGVRYILEGGVRRRAEQLRVTAQLVDAETGGQVWAQRYDRSLSDIFAVQDEITSSVSAAIRPMIDRSERERAVHKPPQSLDAWECYHRGMWHYASVDADELDRATSFFRRAIEIDPHFAQAHAALSAAYSREASFYRPEMREKLIQLSLECAQRAVSIDPMESMAHAVLGDALMMSGQHKDAICEADLAVSLDPNSAYCHSVQAFVRAWGGRPREAIESLDTALKLSPFDPRMQAWLHVRSRAYYFAQNYEAAIATSRQLNRIAPNYPQGYATLIAALGQTGRIDEARAALTEAQARIGERLWFSLSLPRDKILELRSEDREHLLAGFRKAGIDG